MLDWPTCEKCGKTMEPFLQNSFYCKHCECGKKETVTSHGEHICAYCGNNIEGPRYRTAIWPLLEIVSCCESCYKRYHG